MTSNAINAKALRSGTSPAVKSSRPLMATPHKAKITTRTPIKERAMVSSRRPQAAVEGHTRPANASGKNRTTA
jgi:hypothetical protein